MSTFWFESSCCKCLAPDLESMSKQPFQILNLDLTIYHVVLDLDLFQTVLNLPLPFFFCIRTFSLIPGISAQLCLQEIVRTFVFLI